MTPRPDTDRLQRIAALFLAHDEQLHRVALRRGSANPAIVDDACQYAWTELLSSEHVDLTVPWGPVAWLTTCAVRRAWELDHKRRRHEDVGLPADVLVDDVVEKVVLDREQLDLVSLLPERQQRFLLRLAVGYSYREIAAAEDASLRTVERQILRARRRLRDMQFGSGGETRAPHT